MSWKLLLGIAAFYLYITGRLMGAELVFQLLLLQGSINCHIQDTRKFYGKILHENSFNNTNMHRIEDILFKYYNFERKFDHQSQMWCAIRKNLPKHERGFSEVDALTRFPPICSNSRFKLVLAIEDTKRNIDCGMGSVVTFLYRG